MNWEMALVMLPGLVIGITAHEFAHAWSASLLGDNFPRRQGRVSLNPFRHLSLLGTLALVVLPFGWGKPVELNLYNFKRPKRDYLITSLAGPLANVAVAILGVGLMHLLTHTYRHGPHAQFWITLAYHFLAMIVIINVMLAVLNLIPIPPLDGSKIWPCLLPGARPATGGKRSGLFVILFIVLMSTHALDRVIGFAINGVCDRFPQTDEKAFRLSQSQGESAYNQQQYPQAQKLFTDALAINPYSASSYCWRAAAREYQEDWAGALEDLNRSVELEPRDADYRDHRAKALTAVGRLDDAQADRQQAAQLRKAAATRPARRPAAKPPM